MDEPLRSDPPAPTTAGGDAAPVGANGEEAGGDGPNGTGPDGAGRRGRAEQRFRVVFDAMAEFVGLMEPDGTLIEANRTALDFGGLRPEDVVGKKLWEGAWWAGSEEARERLQAAVGRAAHGEFVRYEADVLGAGGRPATLDLSVKPVRGDDGRVDLLIAEGRPITEAVQARRMQEGLVAAQAGTFEIDLATQAVHRSVSTDLIFGFDPDDAPRVLDDYLGRIHPEDLPAALDAIRRAVEEGGEHFVECRLLLPDGRERWMAARGMALPGVRGGSARLVGAIMDVTEQRAAERERRRDDEQRHAALEAAQLGTWDYDLAEAVVHVDERCRAVFGLDRGTVTLDEALARVHPEDRPAVERALGAAADPAGGGRFDVEYRFVRPPGEERWVRATGSTLFEGEGKARRAVRLAGVVMDETERLAAEQRLHESAQRLRLALDAAEMGTWVWDLASGRRVTDARECALLGEPPGAFPTTDAFFARVHPDDLPGLLRKIDEALAGGGDYEHEFRVTHADGTVRWLAARGREARDERGSVRLLGVHFDVTARKAAERALRESERRYRTFLAISQEGIWQFDLDAPIPTDLPVDEQIARMYRDAWLAECNAAFARMYGFERPEEIVGARLPDLLPPDDPANTAYLRAFIENGYRLNVGESHEVDREGRPRVFENTLTGEVEGGCVVRAWGTQRDVTERKAAERDQALLAAIVASSDDAVVSMTLDGVITSWNAGAERVFGYTAEEAVGQPVLMLIPPERRGEEDRLLGRIRQGERVDHYETVRLAKDGRRIDVSAAVSPVRDGAGVLIGASKVARDVTAQKAAERALREGEARLRAAVGAAPLVLTQVDRDLRHTWYYSAYPDVGGGAEILGRRLDELTTPAEAAALQDLQRRVIETGEGARGEVAFRLDDGDHFFDVTVEPLRDGDGRVVGATTASFDVTDRVRAEEALRASEERFRLAAGAVAGMVYDWDVASDEVFRTEGLYDLVGVRPEDVPAERTWWVDLVHPDDRERVFDLIRTVLDSDAKHYAAEYRVRHEDGRWVHLWDRGYIVRDEAGRAVRVVGSAADVSDRKRAEEALRASEERFRLTVSNDALTLFEQDADLRYTWVYPQHPEFPEANIGRTDAELVPGEGGARLMRLKQAVLETGAGVREEVEVPLPTGTRWYDLVIEPHLDDDGRVAGIAGVALDVTDRKRAEAALRESEERFRQLADSAPVLIWVSDEHNRGTYFNRRWLEFTGRTMEEELGFGWAEAIHPDDLEAAVAFCQHHFDARAPFRMEFRLRRADGQYRWVLDHGIPRFAPDGTFLGYVGSCFDLHDRKEAEQALRLYREVFANSVEGVAIIGLDGRYLEQNAAHRALTGFDDADLVGQTPAIHLGEETFARVAAALAERGRWSGEATSRTKDGQEKAVELSAFTVRDAEGRPVCYVGIKRDVSERKAAEAALRASEARFRSMADSSPVMIWITDPEGAVLFVNEAYRAFFGVTEGDMRASGWQPLVHPDDAPAYAAAFAEAIQARAPFRAQARVRRADGAWRWIASYAAPWISEQGELLGMVGSSPDVTEMKEAEARALLLAETGRLVEQALDYEGALREIARLAVPGFADWCAIDLVHDDGSIGAVAIAHADPEKEQWGWALRAQRPVDADAPTGGPNVIRTGQPEFYPDIPDALVQATVADEEELRLVREIGYSSVIIVPMRAGGAVIGAITFVHAESGRHFAEADLAVAEEIGRRAGAVIDTARLHAALSEREARLRAVIDTAVDGIITIDERGTVETMNPAAVRIFGYAPEEVVGKNVNVLMPEPYRSEHDGYIAHYLETGERKIIGIGREVQGRRKDGSVFPMELAVSETLLGGRRLFTGLVRDITERKEAEAALRESEARFRQLAEALPQIVYTLPAAGGDDTEYLNPRWYEYTGMPPGTSYRDAAEGVVHPDDLALVRERWAEAAATGTLVEMEIRLRRHDGRYRWFITRIVPIKDADGRIVRWFGTSTDIQAQKEAEAELAAAVAERTRELERSNRELDQFAYVASHDLKGPLRGIDNLASWIAEDAEEHLPEASRRHLDLLQGRVRRMEALLDSLLVYSRAGRLTGLAEDVDTAALVQAVVELLDAPDAFTFEVEGDLPTLTTYRAPLELVFRNLLSNAVKHADRPDLRVRVWAEDEGAGVPPGFVRFAVSDDGPGIPVAYHERVFGLFQTLRPRDEVEGSGMGLAVVKKTVESLGGTIRVESTPGAGATLYFTWPRRL